MDMRKTMSSKYLKSEDLGGVGAFVAVQISNIEEAVQVGNEEKPIMHFYGKKKTLPMNITNRRLMALPQYQGMQGCNFGWESNDWINQHIELFVSTDRHPEGGMTECVRIRPMGAGAVPAPQPPAPQPPAPEPSAPEDSWDEEPPPSQAGDIPF